jgi:hypothetical protein
VCTFIPARLIGLIGLIVCWLCKLEQCRGPRTWGSHSDPRASVMAAPCLQVLSNSVTRVSSDSDLPTSGEPQGPPIPDETSPLLIKTKDAHLHPTKPRRSALSSFFDNNAGLLLVTASQLFASAMNLSVKVLNSLDDPVPTLEV